MRAARASALSLAVLCALSAFAACGGSSSREESDDGSDGGSSGSSGSSSTGGSNSGGASTGGSGTGGPGTGGPGTGGYPTTGGAGAAPPTGGNGGTPPAGGTGATGTGGFIGEAGQFTGGAECETADDCAMHADCCVCLALPKNKTFVGCERTCVTDHCTAQQIGLDEVTCSFGRCVIDRSCDRRKVTCPSLPEPCDGGYIPSVTDDGCWGPCMFTTDCREVTDCTDCIGSPCVVEETQSFRYGCVQNGTCEPGSYCECLEPCAPPFVCVDEDTSVRCPCPTC